jgi:hypothetical protein
MKKFRSRLIFVIVGLLFVGAGTADDNDPRWTATQSLALEIVSHGQAYANLEQLVAGGSRLSGSEGAARAVTWAKAKLESYGFDRVWLQPVKVPAWSRGDHEAAKAWIAGAQPFDLAVAALGNSVGTSAGGLEAEVVEVNGLAQVQEMGTALRGKIVFYNRPMDASLDDTFDAYSGAADQRTSGPATAARFGAVGALVRTLTTLPDDTHPHTGITSYRGGTKIPAAAVSTHDANRLSALLSSGRGPVRVRLELSARQLPPVTSYNVVAEIRGTELPNEIIDVGGHLDSWDLGPGAHDDGAGAVQSIEVLRAFKVAGVTPRRTIRAVLFMSEEFGGVGADEYARLAKLNGEKHLAAIESDRGGFLPLGFSIKADDPVVEKMRAWGKYLAPVHADRLNPGFAGTDVEPLEETGTLTIGFVPESKHYFDLHHSSLDRLDAVNPDELHLGAASMAVMAYLLSAD